MHPSALKYAKCFFEVYCANSDGWTVLDIGSQNVNGSLKDVCPESMKYVGVDFASGNGVDVVLDDPYKLPFEKESADIIVCSSCFEHSQFFWLLFLEMVRCLKAGGFLYLNVPSNGSLHRYPVDCWRFYPDSGKALADWAAREGTPISLVESFVGARSEGNIEDGGGWNDYVAVFCKIQNIEEIGEKIVDRIGIYATTFSSGFDAEQGESFLSPDHRSISCLKREVFECEAAIAECEARLVECEAKLTECEARLGESDATLGTLLSSRSWRMTEPLRVAGSTVRKFFQKLSGHP
ncbi:methyltransferase domain-containing protein [Candidatus Saccharibacteria bacterium]|nr:methyltransferase domain-containing protein [Candidatus Saccharibacteria bacterium]